MVGETRPLCRKCLLRDMGDDEYFRSIAEYIRELPAAVRTPEPEYSRRLAECQNCDNLVNGMCRLCGCFVELRAAKRINRCAGTPLRWDSMQQEDH